MIKAYRLPFFAAVACFAFGAITSVMNIADTVTIDARRADTFPPLIGVAGGARDFDVRADEGEFRFAVIEGVSRLPCGHAMATIARVA